MREPNASPLKYCSAFQNLCHTIALQQLAIGLLPRINQEAAAVNLSYRRCNLALEALKIVTNRLDICQTS